MISQLVITTPASARTLLTQAQRRAAVGVADASQDTALEALDLRVADTISAECNIAVGSGAEPTLLKERLTETFRFVSTDELILARRHNVDVISVSVDGAALDTDDLFVDAEAGILIRAGSYCRHWNGQSVVVVYDAGFTAGAIPGDLLQAAMDFTRLAWQEKSRDPALKSEVIDIPNVQRIERSFWVGSVPGQGGGGAVPDIVGEQLKRYRNESVA